MRLSAIALREISGDGEVRGEGRRGAGEGGGG
jgi:hypothetical protein